jgi:hypothetical protein
MTVDELLDKAAACQSCGKKHEHRRISPAGGTWAAPDGHPYRPAMGIGAVAKLRYLATGEYEDPWGLPPESGLKRVLARVFD